MTSKLTVQPSLIVPFLNDGDNQQDKLEKNKKADKN